MGDEKNYAGYEEFERGGSRVVEVENPRPFDDDYYHGDNPADTATAGSIELEAGESTAASQDRNDGAGWNREAGPGDSSGQAPDHSWRVADIRDYAKRNNIDVGEASTKDELLAKIKG